jgi:hypothetical protein
MLYLVILIQFGYFYILFQVNCYQARLRASTDRQDLNNQKLEILEFSRERYVRVDEFVAITISSHKPSRQRRIDELLATLSEFDTLIASLNSAAWAVVPRR